MAQPPDLAMSVDLAKSDLTALPDLASRLRAAPSVAIAPPDDRLLAAVLVKLFADRQVRVAPEVIAFLLRRMERRTAKQLTVPSLVWPKGDSLGEPVLTGPGA